MNIQNLSLSFGEQEIYRNSSITFNKFDKVGIVGVNGAGKTTLFRIIMGEVMPDQGAVNISKDEHIGYLPQVIDLSDTRSVYEYIYSGRPIRELQKRQQELGERLSISNDDEEIKILLKKYATVQQSLEYWEEYSADAILKKITKGMNIKEELLNSKVCDLSGGEKSKVAFAKLLFEKPNIILLDEPTNHLDQESKEWVINYLKNYKGLILIISHDTKFLDEITNKTLYVDKQTHTLQMFNGNYSNFVRLYEEYKLSVDRVVAEQERKEKKLIDIIQRAEGGSVKRKRQAKSREKELEKLQENKIERIKEDKHAKISIQSAGNSAKVPISVEDISFGYNPQKPLIKNLTFKINDKDRFLIAGYNGVGKSTLLKLIMGKLNPNKGYIYINPKTEIAYYDQEQQNLYGTETILEHFEQSGLSQKEIRGMLSKFLFFNKDVNKQLKVLSPGERCRVAFAEIALQKSNTLILDEPTNHLDPQTQRIIAQNFYDYDGTILLVSHNPDFVEGLGIDKVLLLPKEKIMNYDRNMLEEIQKHNEIS